MPPKDSLCASAGSRWPIADQSIDLWLLRGELELDVGAVTEALTSFRRAAHESDQGARRRLHCLARLGEAHALRVRGELEGVLSLAADVLRLATVDELREEAGRDTACAEPPTSSRGVSTRVSWNIASRSSWRPIPNTPRALTAVWVIRPMHEDACTARTFVFRSASNCAASMA